MPLQTNYPYDANLLLKDAGAITADAAGTVAAAAKVVDLGDADVEGVCVADVTALDVASTDELYFVILEGCNTADFTTGSPQIEPLAVLVLGAGGVIPGAGATSSVVDKHALPFINSRGSTRFRYVRIYTDVNGTSPSINYSAWLSFKKRM